ncbi:hypothetical protein D3C71_1306190 [compost metagenome]
MRLRDPVAVNGLGRMGDFCIAARLGQDAVFFFHGLENFLVQLLCHHDGLPVCRHGCFVGLKCGAAVPAWLPRFLRDRAILRGVRGRGGIVLGHLNVVLGKSRRTCGLQIKRCAFGQTVAVLQRRRGVYEGRLRNAGKYVGMCRSEHLPVRELAPDSHFQIHPLAFALEVRHELPGAHLAVEMGAFRRSSG